MEDTVTKPPNIPGVCERDVDLLLLEELYANPDFREWFIPRCCGLIAGSAELVEVKRSVTQSSGESDLELTCRQPDGTLAKLLIENKVDAAFQREQAARYTQRARAYVANGHCACVRTVLIAPRDYFGAKRDSHGFDGALTYEEIQDWFLRSALGARGLYKAVILKAAINKATLGYNPIADDVVSRFWYAYWEISIAQAPELAMNRPGSKPARSTWIYFAPSGLPPNARLVHKLGHGVIELTLGGAGERLGELRSALRDILTRDMVVERTGKSSSIRLKVPEVNASQDIDAQRAAVSAGLDAARQLLAWAQRHRELLATTVTSMEPQ